VLFYLQCHLKFSALLAYLKHETLSGQHSDLVQHQQALTSWQLAHTWHGKDFAVGFFPTRLVQ